MVNDEKSFFWDPREHTQTQRCFRSLLLLRTDTVWVQEESSKQRNSAWPLNQRVSQMVPDLAREWIIMPDKNASFWFFEPRSARRNVK